jgi:hypothetical protein
MKMAELHVVPLAHQSITLLEELQPFARAGRYVFPSLRSRDRPMSNNTINGALRRLGYSTEEQTGHGFRTMASTLLNEQGFPPDVIELQLAHAERNKLRAAYNKAQRLPERRKMMEAWADYLDGLRAGATIVPIKRRLPYCIQSDTMPNTIQRTAEFDLWLGALRDRKAQARILARIISAQHGNCGTARRSETL